MTVPARSSQPPDADAAGRALVERLNREWRITAPDIPQPSFKQRLARPIRHAFAVLFRPQETFNSVVVQQMNALRGMIDDVFVRIDHTNDALDEMLRLSEGLTARERRIEAGFTVLRGQQEELRTALGVLQHQTHHLSKVLTSAPSGAPAAPRSAPAAHADGGAAPSHALSHKYVGFEDAFRGSPEAIRAGLAAYVPLFAGASDVLDVGCGRGEFLSLLQDNGIGGRGIDLNETMVEICRGRGLNAAAADALSHLREQPDASLGGLFAAQVVEHLQPGYLTQLLDAAFDKLRPGAPIVLETINPACWFAFFSSYIRDITHERPLHPDTLKFLLVASGFHQVDIRYSSPYPEHDKLQRVTSPGVPADAAETLNANVEKINGLLFTYLDYAAVARRP